MHTRERLSIIVPAHNESRTIGIILHKLSELPDSGMEHEVIVVDDGSTDGTAAIAEGFAAGRPGWSVLRHVRNLGKGAAVRTALAAATGDAVIIQDADLEYDPADIPKLERAYLESGGRVAIYGSRNLHKNDYAHFSYYLGGRLITLFANLLYGLRLTDIFTGYKLVPMVYMRQIGLGAVGFEFCVEVTAKLTRLGIAILEVPIGYHARTFAEGKQIRARDGWISLKTLIRYRSWRRQ